MMNKNDAKSALSLAQKLQKEFENKSIRSTSKTVAWVGSEILPFDIVKGTRGYIEKVVRQINICYSAEAYDACWVMIRRLIETLIIECFEKHKIDNIIKDNDGHFFMLEKLIDAFLKQSIWNVGRESKNALPKILKKVKKFGDNSAHNRRFNARKPDVDRSIDDLRVLVEELINIAYPNL